MPQYDYRNADEIGCEHCQGGFTVRQGLGEPPLPVCPRCGAAVTRVITTFSVNTPRIGRRFNERRARAAGFSVLRNEGDGRFRVN